MLDNYQRKIITGWTSLLLLTILMVMFMIYTSVYENNDFAALKHDPGAAGLNAVIVLTAIYAVMPFVVYLIQSSNVRFLRWICVVVAMLSMLFLIMHHLKHFTEGSRPDAVSNLIDILMHLIGAWIIYFSIRWALWKGE